jgi:hypothetical protein
VTRRGEPARDRSRVDAARQEKAERTIGDEAQLDRLVEQRARSCRPATAAASSSDWTSSVRREIELEPCALASAWMFAKIVRGAGCSDARVRVDRVGGECAPLARQPRQHAAHERAEGEAVSSCAYTSGFRPMRSRTTCTRFVRKSTIANANMPRSRGSSASMPQAS